MKPLILSFFAVILGYSIFFDNEKENHEVVSDTNSSTPQEVSAAVQKLDSTVNYTNRTAELLRK